MLRSISCLAILLIRFARHTASDLKRWWSAQRNLDSSFNCCDSARSVREISSRRFVRTKTRSLFSFACTASTCSSFLKAASFSRLRLWILSISDLLTMRVFETSALLDCSRLFETESSTIFSERALLQSAAFVLSISSSAFSDKKKEDIRV